MRRVTALSPYLLSELSFTCLTLSCVTSVSDTCTAQLTVALPVSDPEPELCWAGRDLATIGDSVYISVTKDGVKFSTSGDIGSANITIRCAGAVFLAVDQTLQMAVGRHVSNAHGKGVEGALCARFSYQSKYWDRQAVA